MQETEIYGVFDEFSKFLSGVIEGEIDITEIIVDLEQMTHEA